MPDSQKLKLLLLEDSEADAALLMRHLSKAGLTFDAPRVDNEKDYVAFLEAHGAGLDAILSDFAMPSFDGLRGLELLQSHGLDVPFILVSGTMGENIAVDAMRRGAADYVLKADLTRLATALRRALERRRLHAENHRLEEQLRQSQKMEAIGQLAAGVAHDFNNLLTIIRANASQLSDGLSPVEDVVMLSEEVLGAVDRAAALTRQLLLFTRKQAARLSVIGLNEVITELAKMLKRIVAEDITLEVSLKKNLPAVLADPAMIEQVVMNLTTNARDAMPRGGKIVISTSEVEIGDADADQVPPGRYACISVQDNGEGISPVHLEHVFEPFFTTKGVGKGTGLGLATVYGIVRQHRGDVTIRSVVGEGTTFRVLLPMHELPLVIGQRELRKEGKLTQGNGTVLVVEDEPAVQAAVTRVLRRQGYVVLLANSGPDALDVWEQHKRSIDLLLTDLVMPLGMRGQELAQRLCLEKPSLRVIMMTGYSADFASGEVPLPEGYQLLQKPFAADELLRSVADALTAAPST
jgi:signal transduction histidine kinase